MGTLTATRVAPRGHQDVAGPVLRPGRLAFWLSGALALTAAMSALLTFLLPSILRGPPVMNGSARGTALVIVLLGVPVLTCSLALAWRGSTRAVLTWLGATGFLVYNSLMFLFATPVNRLFPLYLAMFSLAAWSIAALVRQIDVHALARRFPARVPARGVAVYVWIIVALNAVAWLSRIVPGLASGGVPSYLHGTGLTTNVVFVQDLALWLPLMAVAAAWLWRRRPLGYLIIGAGLVMWLIENACVSVDQWYGHAADPASSVAAGAMVPVFAALAVIGLAPACYLLRGLGTGQPASSAAGSAADRPAGVLPAAGARGWPAGIYTAIALFLAGGAIYGGTQLIRTGFGMPLSWLSHTPFTNWTLPGLALLIGVAVPQLTTVVLIAASHSWALVASYLAGLAVIAWIAVQLLVLQRYFFLQPIIAGLGLAEFLFAWIWQRRSGQ